MATNCFVAAKSNLIHAKKLAILIISAKIHKHLITNHFHDM